MFTVTDFTHADHSHGFAELSLLTAFKYKLRDFMLPPSATALSPVIAAIMYKMLLYTRKPNGVPWLDCLVDTESDHRTWLVEHWEHVQYMASTGMDSIPAPDSEAWRHVLCSVTERYLGVHIDDGYSATHCYEY
jgi:hypothetical protein